MNLKEIIIEELRHTLNLYKSRDNSEISIDIAFELEPMIKGIANNIISKMGWQVIASGEVKGKYDGNIGDKSMYNIENKILSYAGKDVEIAVREIRQIK